MILGTTSDNYMCSHPNLAPTAWEQKKPEPCAMIVMCCERNVSCPICGYGWGQAPCCNDIKIIPNNSPDSVSRGTGEYCLEARKFMQDAK